MSNDISIQSENMSAQLLESVLVNGELQNLSVKERLQYLANLCQGLGLNPLTRPFEYVKFQGKMVLYARKDCTEQLRKLHNVTISKITVQHLQDAVCVTAVATLPNGRTDSDVGVVDLTNLRGSDLANAIMKAHTKAKRRVTLSICGLGVLDESELETISDARPVHDHDEDEKYRRMMAVDRSGDLKQLKLNYQEAYRFGMVTKDQVFLNRLTAAKDIVKKRLSAECVDPQYFNEEPNYEANDATIQNS